MAQKTFPHRGHSPKFLQRLLVHYAFINYFGLGVVFSFVYFILIVCEKMDDIENLTLFEIV